MCEDYAARQQVKRLQRKVPPFRSVAYKLQVHQVPILHLVWLEIWLKFFHTKNLQEKRMQTNSTSSSKAASVRSLDTSCWLACCSGGSWFRGLGLLVCVLVLVHFECLMYSCTIEPGTSTKLINLPELRYLTCWEMDQVDKVHQVHWFLQSNSSDVQTTKCHLSCENINYIFEAEFMQAFVKLGHKVSSEDFLMIQCGATLSFNH